MTRLFELDFQLLHDTVLLAISVFFLCVALSYLLFEPARKLLRERTEHIGDELRMAKKEKKQERNTAHPTRNTYRRRIKKWSVC